MLTAGVWLLHDNAPVHKSMIAQQAIHECGFIKLDHPAYSPDLAPSDYYLFRNLKSYLRGQRYQDDDALKSAVENWLEGQSAELYSAGIASLPKQELVGGAVSITLFSRHCKPARTRTGWRGRYGIVGFNVPIDTL